MDVQTDDEMAADAIRLVTSMAWRQGRLPPGLIPDDLESAGNEAVVHALADYDPTTGVPWVKFAALKIGWAMTDVVRKFRGRGRTPRQQPARLQGCDLDGELLPLPADPRVSDPAAIAAARECLPAARTIGVLELGLPDRSAVATQANRLRAAMMDAITPDDAADVVRAQVEKAKGGDTKAARFVSDLVGAINRPRPAASNHQQVVVVNPGDVG